MAAATASQRTCIRPAHPAAAMRVHMHFFTKSAACALNLRLYALIEPEIIVRNIHRFDSKHLVPLSGQARRKLVAINATGAICVQLVKQCPAQSHRRQL